MPGFSPVFAQVTSALHPQEFARCVAQFPSPRRPRGLSAYDHFLALCFAQLTGREGLRDLVVCLNARPNRAYQAGFRTRLTRTNLAYANEHRDWRTVAAVAQLLMRRTARLYADDPMESDLPHLSYALDASLIDLSLALFPWANWQHTDAAVKLHTLLSLRTPVPVWTAVTEGQIHDSKMLAQIPVEKGAFYVMDRGYLDFRGLARLQAAGAFFVVRSKCHLRLRVVNSQPVDKNLGLRCDQTVKLVTGWSRRRFRGLLRRIRIYDTTYQRSLAFLTNQFELPAITIAELYRRRWQVELFFKWIKQHLRLRAFLGRSQNAVRLQVWAAICSYLLVAIAKKQLGLPQSLHQILQVISVSVFEPVPLSELFANRPLQSDESNQLLLIP
jgi:transposase